MSHLRHSERDDYDEDGPPPRLLLPPANPVRDRRPETRAERRSFAKVRRAEVVYGRRLRGIAAQVGELVRALFDPAEPGPSERRVRAALEQYAGFIREWAAATGAAMIADVSRRDEAVWAHLGRDMGLALRDEIRNAPTGEVLRRLLDEQVHYITSLPREAAQRVHQLTLAGIEDSSRAATVAEAIMRSGEVSRGRAMLIARTETTRTASALVQSRSEYVGSEGYIWRTAEDSDVRELHRRLEGKFIRWDEPPVAGSRGERAHAGMIYNCRCYPEPVIPQFEAA